MTSRSPQTAKAIAARRQQTERKLTRVEKTINQIRRERGRVTVRAVAQRAEVSTTFLYENPAARALVQAAAEAGADRLDHNARDQHDRVEATWRERALNAEAELTRTQKEVLTQRQRIAELMGQIRDFDQMAPGESVQRLVTENTSLKTTIRQLTAEHRELQERLEGARSTNRFLNKRVADLETQILDQRGADQ
jgi:chromosome segregation ATPase